MTQQAARSPRKPRGQGGERREEILVAAERLFAEHGLGAVSTRRIAQAVGISQAALFGHFPSRDDLSAALCIRALEAMAQAIGAAAEAPGPHRLERVFAAYVAFALTAPDRYRLALMVERGPDGAFLERVQGRPMEAGVAAFLQLRAAVAQETGAEGDAATRLTQSAWASLHGLASLLIARPEFPWGDRDALVREHVRRAASSLTRRPPP